jgi:hypothetical protein
LKANIKQPSGRFDEAKLRVLIEVQLFFSSAFVFYPTKNRLVTVNDGKNGT